MAEELSSTADGRLASVQRLDDRQTLEESAYKEMRRVIMDGGLVPGERISVNAMAQRLGVSRLPVIHALRRLASEGFVKIRPHKSPTVNQPTRKDLRVRSLMMVSLEEIAVREAWPLAPHFLNEMEAFYRRSCQEIEAGLSDEQADWRFHEVVWRASGVEQLRFAIQTLWDQGAYYRTMGLKTYGILPARIAEHSVILQAFSNPTPDEAVARIRSHRLGALERLNNLFVEAGDDGA